jgi:hypothetical protein
MHHWVYCGGRSWSKRKRRSTATYELAELAAQAEKEEKEKNQAHEKGGESYN